MARSNQKEVKETGENTPDSEQVLVTFTDDVCISDGERELVITINVEFAFDVPVDGKFNDDNYMLVSNNISKSFYEDEK
jgi:hypothetical protein